MISQVPAAAAQQPRAAPMARADRARPEDAEDRGDHRPPYERFLEALEDLLRERERRRSGDRRLLDRAGADRRGGTRAQARPRAPKRLLRRGRHRPDRCAHGRPRACQLPPRAAGLQPAPACRGRASLRRRQQLCRVRPQSRHPRAAARASRAHADAARRHRLRCQSLAEGECVAVAGPRLLQCARAPGLPRGHPWLGRDADSLRPPAQDPDHRHPRHDLRGAGEPQRLPLADRHLGLPVHGSPVSTSNRRAGSSCCRSATISACSRS
jgi:hypothetical protein